MLAISFGPILSAAVPVATLQPTLQVVDLSVGEAQEVALPDGTKVLVKLLDLQETRDTINRAVRLARVKIAVDAHEVTLESGNYRLPVKVKSDGNVKPLNKDGFAITTHQFTKPGHYLVRVERRNERDEVAVTHLSVQVGP